MLSYQVVEQLRERILPQARQLLNKARRDAGTTIPTSFEQVSTESSCLAALVMGPLQICIGVQKKLCHRHAASAAWPLRLDIPYLLMLPSNS